MAIAPKTRIGLALACAVCLIVVLRWSVLSARTGHNLVPTDAPDAAEVCQPATGSISALSFDLLTQTVVSATPPPKYLPQLHALEGKRVRISGFVMPFHDPEMLTQLMLVKSSGLCSCCNPPDLNAKVLVRRKTQDAPLALDGQPQTFVGTLHLWRSDLPEMSESRRFLFTLDDASIVERQKFPSGK